MVFYHPIILLYFISSGSLSNIFSQAEPLEGKNVIRVEENKYPYVASIGHDHDLYHEEEMHVCTGVLISNRFVLTAAHCLDMNSFNSIRVILGSNDLRNGKKYTVSTWITYDEWAESNNITKIKNANDIAMIKLLRKVSRQITPASLSSEKKINLYNEYVVIVGWGMSNELSETPTRYLHEAKVKVVPNLVCENISYDIFKEKTAIADKYLCTKAEPYTLLGNGDSGGPVFKDNSVVAISRAVCPKTSHCDLPKEVIKTHKFNAHISIDLYREFIDHVLNNY